jgi:type VI protein secretion system component Hcp
MPDASTDILMKCHDKAGQVIHAECPLTISEDDTMALNKARGFYFKAPAFTTGSYSLVDNFNFAVELIDHESEEYKAMEKRAKNSTGSGVLAEDEGGEGPRIQQAYDPSKTEFFRWRSDKEWNKPASGPNAEPKFRVKAGEFSISRRIDKASPILFKSLCNQEPLKFVSIVKRMSLGTRPAEEKATGSKIMTYLRIDFVDVMIVGIDWNDGEVLEEKCRFEARQALAVYFMAMDAAFKLVAVPAATWTNPLMKE